MSQTRPGYCELISDCRHPRCDCGPNEPQDEDEPPSAAAETPRVTTRKEDMSVRGMLRLIKQDDGDIIIAVHKQTHDGLRSGGESVEFCSSGGHSPNTRAALYALFDAMEKDNAEYPAGRVQS